MGSVDFTDVRNLLDKTLEQWQSSLANKQISNEQHIDELKAIYEKTIDELQATYDGFKVEKEAARETEIGQLQEINDKHKEEFKKVYQHRIDFLQRKIRDLFKANEDAMKKIKAAYQERDSNFREVFAQRANGTDEVAEFCRIILEKWPS
jgi:hypothetical protein